ncbi:DUF6296 family protein [Kitasatospora sp. MBT63]|uniref:DUF6296 family protein n=1 Tax=Kitasatospora sp. MBT63 TaxID=1444768 RepID=UPI00053A0C0C|nr:DUF6296 family protein [Kitasatospora sp. MBT63]
MTTPTASRWLLTFPGPQGCHGKQESVLVEHHGARGPNGHPLYSNAGRTVQVEITENGVAYLLSSGDLPMPDTPVHAQPLP